MPGPVAEVADYGLHQQPCQWCCNPQHRDLVLGCSERLKNPRHVAPLEGKAELDAEKPETHVPDFPKGKPFGVHCLKLKCPRPMAGGIKSNSGLCRPAIRGRCCRNSKGSPRGRQRRSGHHQWYQTDMTSLW